ncbi:MAG: hypothetical protein U0T77_11435 [Chitinophagales bacterium]
MKEKSDNATNARQRREVILGGLALFATAFVVFNPFKTNSGKSASKSASEKYKMLSEDGKLVEIDASVIEMCRKRKVSKEELQDWVKEK